MSYATLLKALGGTVPNEATENEATATVASHDADEPHDTPATDADASVVSHGPTRPAPPVETNGSVETHGSVETNGSAGTNGSVETHKERLVRHESGTRLVEYHFVTGGAVVHGLSSEEDGFHPFASSVVRSLADPGLSAWRERELALLAADSASVLVELVGRPSQAASYLLNQLDVSSRANYVEASTFKNRLAALPRIGNGTGARVTAALRAVSEWLGDRRIVRSDAVGFAHGVCGRVDLVVDDGQGMLGVVAGLHPEPSWSDIANAAICGARGVVISGVVRPITPVVLGVHGCLVEVRLDAADVDRIASFVGEMRRAVYAGAVFGSLQGSREG